MEGNRRGTISRAADKELAEEDGQQEQEEIAERSVSEEEWKRWREDTEGEEKEDVEEDLVEELDEMKGGDTALELSLRRQL